MILVLDEEEGYDGNGDRQNFEKGEESSRR
jgi:hypothetical protein